MAMVGRGGAGASSQHQGRGTTRGSIDGMKISVSLPDTDVEFLDAYAAEHTLGSRSAALQRAVEALRLSALPGGYATAWAEWDGDGSAAVWDSAATDGLA